MVSLVKKVNFYPNFEEYMDISVREMLEKHKEERLAYKKWEIERNKTKVNNFCATLQKYGVFTLNSLEPKVVAMLTWNKNWTMNEKLKIRYSDMDE